MRSREVAYLGPQGTYAHDVAEKRYGRVAELIPFETTFEVCDFAAKKPNRLGVVPIENTSGGTIYPTVDILSDYKPSMRVRPSLHIEEELSINVKLALAGRAREKIKTLYSHPAAMSHCDEWLRAHLPHVERCDVMSTAMAAREASEKQNAAALCSKKACRAYELDILKYPVRSKVLNVTAFYAVTRKRQVLSGSSKTSIAFRLKNVAGALCRFLEPFKNEDVNLSRIISRTIEGCPNEYAFFVSIDGIPQNRSVKRAIDKATSVCESLRIVGTYPVHRRYVS
jgi:prephenate dehydratase